MGRVLKHNTVVRRNPPIGELTVLKAGETVPDWAENLVGDHLFEDDRGGVAAPKEVDRSLVQLPEEPPQPEEELKVPKRNAAAATWRKFAKEASVTLPAKATRDEIIEKVLESYPDLEIPEA